MLKITKRKMTFEDFLKLKKFEPTKSFRNKSKGVNFSAEFGAAGSAIGVALRDLYQFTEQDCDDTIDTLNLHGVLKQAILNNKRGLSKADIKYNVCGTAFRELFFKTYPGLMRRIEREHEFMYQNGFTRTWVGPVRHHSPIRYMKFGKNHSLVGADKNLYSGTLRHLQNNAANTGIQTAEVLHAMPDIVAIQQNIDDWGLKSFIYCFIHDSMEIALYHKEKNLVLALCNRVATVVRQPSYKLPIMLDAEVSDYRNGDYFKHGKEITLEDYDLDKELEKWNQEWNMNLSYIDYLPFTEEGRKNLRALQGLEEED